MVDSLSKQFVFASTVAVSMALACPAQIEIDLTDVTSAGQVVEVGATAPAPTWGKWLVGEPVPHGKGSITVFAFYTGRAARRLVGDGDYLAELQKRLGDRPLTIVAVVGEDVEKAPANWQPCRVVVDAGLAMTTTWLGGDPGQNNLFILDGDAQVTFRGQLGHGVVDAIDRTFAGKPRIADERRIRRLLDGLESNFDSIVGAAAEKQLAPILIHAPRHARALALAYLAAATKRYDMKAAAVQRKAAIGLLANDSRPLAVFADLALRGEPQSRELAIELAMALVPAMAAAPNDPVVQLAYLRALVLAGQDRQVGRQAMTTRKLVFGTAANAVAFCDILTQANMPQVHRDLCEQAIQKAEALGASPRQLTALRYVVAKRCAEDDDAAAKILDAYAQRVGSRGSINNDCWYFMTTLTTMGRHNVFAAALAEKMLTEKEQMDSFEFDTAALAMFLAGRAQEAVDLQESALAKGGAGDPEYVERLERYRAAVKAAASEPSKPDK